MADADADIDADWLMANYIILKSHCLFFTLNKEQEFNNNIRNQTAELYCKYIYILWIK